MATFVPTEKPEFLAHPVSFMKYQAEALGLPHLTLEITEPFKESYEKAIQLLKEKYGVTALITGDIAEVNGAPNWIRECSKFSGMDVLTPLWKWERIDIINRLISCKFKVIFSCVKKPWFTNDWVGMEINPDSLEKLRELSGKTGLDICGEQGEYHTMVLDGPLFKKSIHITADGKLVKDHLMYIDIQKAVLQEK